MRLSKLLITKMVFMLMPGIVTRVAAQLPLSETGMVSILDKDPTIDNTGSVDVTEKLRTAFQTIADDDSTAYVPPGTYLVSGTLSIENQKHVGMDFCADRSGKGSVAIVGDPEAPPVFKLAEGSFTDVNNPQPVLKIWRQSNKTGDAIGVERTACNYFAAIRDIHIDLQNNPGASGVDFGAAQETTMANIHITGADFHSGFMGLPGANQANVNLKVTGGRYGVWMNGALAEGTTLTGITLDGQSENAVYVVKGTYRGSTFVGLDIRNCGGTAIYVNAYSGTKASTNGHLTIVDSRVELANDTDFAIYRKDKAISLINVFVKGTNKIVSGTENNFSSNSLPENWTHVNHYTFVPNLIPDNKTIYGFIVVDGTRLGGGQEIKAFIPNVTAPSADITSRHLPTIPGTDELLFSFKTNGMTSFKDYKTDNNTWGEALQDALNSTATHIFIPSGSYLIDRLISIPSGKSLVGIPGYRSKLVPDYDAIKPTERCWLISTEDAHGFSALQDIRINTEDKAYLGAYHWRASDGIVFGITQYDGSGHSELDKRHYKFSGSAGGKVYGTSDQNNLISGKVADPNFRKIYIENTVNPITFYGLNLERGGFPREVTQYTFFEAVNSNNIRIFGCKTETWGTVFTFTNCSNFMLTNVMSNKTNEEPIIDISANSTDFAVSTVVVSNGNAEGSVLLEDGDVTSEENKVKRPHFIGWYSEGNFDDAVFNHKTLPEKYELTITNGTGNGQYAERTIIGIYANPPGAGRQFDQWTGDVANVGDLYIANTTVTMPAGEVSLTATYSKITKVTESFNLKDELKVYPNPASRQLTIEMDDASLYSLKLFNSLGQLRGQWNDLSGTVHIDCAHYHEGLYFWEISNDQQIFKGKVLLVKKPYN